MTVGENELQLIQQHIVLQEIIELINQDILSIRDSRILLKGLKEQTAKTTLACFLLELKASR